MAKKRNPPGGAPPLQSVSQSGTTWCKIKEVQVRTRGGEPFLALVTTGGQKVLLPKAWLANTGLFKLDSALSQMQEAVKAWIQHDASVWCVFDPSVQDGVLIEIKDQGFTPEPVVFGTP